jgi:hypothetical protein
VSDWLPDDATEWHGRPVARRVADAEARQRAVLKGVVRVVVAHSTRQVRGESGRATRRGAGSALDAWIDDGTGSITLRWLGREAIAGVDPGANLEVEGTVSSQHGRLVILNPLYRFVGCSPGTDVPGSGPAIDSDIAAPLDAQAETSISW